MTLPNFIENDVEVRNVISDRLFFGCTSLTSVSIPSNVSQIGISAFQNCTSLNLLGISNNVRYVGDFAFKNCTGLTFVSINSNRIGSRAFQDCSNLSQLTIGSRVGEIYNDAFYGCSGLDRITSWSEYAPMLFHEEEDEENGGINDHVDFSFDNVRDNIPVYVPCGSVESYRNSWRNFTEFVDGGGDRRISVNSADETMGTARVVTHPTCHSSVATIAATPNPGYKFTNWTVNNNVVSNSAIHTFTASSDRTLTANFANCNNPIDDLPYTENFDSYTTSTTPKTGVQPPCWTLVHQDVPMTDPYTPMIYYGSSLAHSGNYSLILNKRGIYAMSRYEGNVSSLHLRMYLKQTQARYQLQVGVMSDLGDASTFVPVSSINNSSTNSEQVTVSFANYTGNGHYIAFRNILASGYSGEYSCNYIDDLTLSDTYTISATANPSDGGIVGGAGEYPNNSSCTLTATPYSDYVFINWTEGSTVVSTSASYTFTVTADRTLTANFAHIITANVDPAEGGIVTGGDIYRHGSPCTLTATPNSGYDFINWTEGSTEVSTNASYTFTVTANRALTANFIRIYTITATTNPTAGGMVAGAGLYTSGSTCTLTATPNSGYVFTNWSEGGTVVSSNATYSFTVNSNRTLKANFVPRTILRYTISAIANPTEGGTLSGAGSYASGSICTLTATPSSGYIFTNWTEGGTVVSTNAEYSFAVSSDRALTAKFEPFVACDISVADLPYTDNFDSYTTSTTAKTGVEPPCWTLAHQYVTITDDYKPMIYYNSSYTHSGDYSLILNKRCIYAMPRYAGNVNTLQLQFYLTQPQTKYQLQVGVMTSLTNESSFVPVATFNNSGTTPVLRMVDFSSYTGNGHYIAFKNILASGNTGNYSCNYIDDLVLSSNTSACGITVADLPYTDNFDTYTTSTTAKTGVEPDCWTLAHQDVSMANEYKPMVYYASANAHSGSYSLLLNKRGIYAMPEFDGDVRTLQLSMYVKQGQAKYQLQVGVMSNLSDASTFVPVTTINNSSTSSELSTVNFANYTGTGRYIAFRNILASGYTGDYSCNYIDDLVLSSNISACGITVADLPYTDNFDTYTNSTTAKTGVEPDCWVLAHQYVTMTEAYKPMIYYASSNAHSGNYSLLLNKRGIYVMPEYEGDVSTLQLSMYVKQGQDKYQLQVGVMSDISDVSTFVPVATINNTSTTASVLSTVSFANYTGTGRYIAFRNILAPGYTGEYSCNYIDDIRLESRCSIYPDELPYADNFDSYTTSTTAKTGVEPTCWTLAHRDVSMTAEYQPMIYFNSVNAYSGSYSLILNKRGIYAMPAYSGSVRTLQLQFYVKQTALKNQLQVGVMSDLSDASTFVPVATIDNASYTAYEYKAVSFSTYMGDGHYIAFRNILAPGYTGDFSCNYIDDLTLCVAGDASKSAEYVDVTPRQHHLNIYPNPTTGMVNVTAEEEVQRIEVYDYTGRSVATYERQSTIDLSRLATGIYTLRVILPERIEVRRVVKQ